MAVKHTRHFNRSSAFAVEDYVFADTETAD